MNITKLELMKRFEGVKDWTKATEDQIAARKEYLLTYSRQLCQSGPKHDFRYGFWDWITKPGAMYRICRICAAKGARGGQLQKEYDKAVKREQDERLASAKRALAPALNAAATGQALLAEAALNNARGLSGSALANSAMSQSDHKPSITVKLEPKKDFVDLLDEHDMPQEMKIKMLTFYISNGGK